jgi:hypothetical protein
LSVPQPEDIYVRTKEEGRRRLERPFVEVVSTALAAPPPGTCSAGSAW